MKPKIHPSYKKVEVKIGNDIFETMSTYKGNQILMDIDFRTHPAWTQKGVITANETNYSVSSFNKKFSGVSFIKK